MAHLHGSSDYRPQTSPRAQGVADRLADTAQDIGERVRDTGNDIAAAVQERPYTTMAFAGGLAFAIGALWMLSKQKRPQSQLDALLARLPEMPDRKSVARLWRS